MVRRGLGTLGGLYELVRLLAITGFRVKGRYWAWRRATAMGEGRGLSRRERARATLEYARWVHRMRGLARRRGG